MSRRGFDTLLDTNAAYALGLSTFAGLATGVGGLIAIYRRPDDALLAFLLGTAIGVMGFLSVFELFLMNAIENGFLVITLATAAGAGFYVGVEPFFPDFQPVDSSKQPSTSTAGSDPMTPKGADDRDPTQKGDRSPARLLRLGFLMALTMTMHNLPEGFAVAMAAFTNFGPIMAAAIAVHNIPEGVIVAAPVFAATGSRWKSLALALASGLSEPLGAMLALLFIKPSLTPRRLQYMLAFVGGIMGAVCYVELLPEGLRCRHNTNLVRGVIVGAVVIAITLVYA